MLVNDPRCTFHLLWKRKNVGRRKKRRKKEWRRVEFPNFFSERCLVSILSLVGFSRTNEYVSLARRFRMGFMYGKATMTLYVQVKYQLEVSWKPTSSAEFSHMAKKQTMQDICDTVVGDDEWWDKERYVFCSLWKRQLFVGLPFLLAAELTSFYR